MKKTYVTTMPNHIGAFLKASECFARLGINITRVSYNKAIDSHTLFIEAQGDKEKLLEADKELTAIGYLQSPKNENSIALLEFTLKDVPGSVTEVLRIIQDFGLNISYISSQENGSPEQAFKMGLFVEDTNRFQSFLEKARTVCPVRILDYNHSEKVYDNSIFYQSFVSGLVKILGLSEDKREELLVNSNLVMQMLDEKGLSPYKTFESISRFTELLAACRGNAFSPRITHHQITEKTEIILIEPACGSNTAIIKSSGHYLFIDCGYALYREEMLSIFRNLIEDFDSIEKKIFITHADLDHCGLLPLFDEVYASSDSKECLTLEYNGKNGFREDNPLHKPYISICKALTFYRPPEPDKVKALWQSPSNQTQPLEQIGFFDFEELHFEVYQGKGGHLKGETVLIDYAHHLAFTGDIYVNMHGMTKEQAAYNQYAPVLMTSVDTDPSLCAIERNAIMQRLGEGSWQIFGAHGMKKEHTLTIDDYLRSFVEIARRIIGDKLLGIYLHGSAAMGCYNPLTSDLDLIVGVSEELGQTIKRDFMDEIVSLHEKMLAGNKWTYAKKNHGGIEMSVVTKSACNPFIYPTPFDLHFSAMHLDWYKKNPEDYISKMKGTDKDLAAHFTVIKNRGRCLYGMPIDDFFGEVPTENYLDSIMEDVADAENEIGIAENANYLILNLARVLAFKMEGLVLSKKEGGEWALENLPVEYHALIKLALKEYKDGQPAHYDQALSVSYAKYMVNKLGKFNN